MQKFPLRMKDNDLLVTELYKDPSNDHITAISVYLTPKTTSKYKFLINLIFYSKKASINIFALYCNFVFEKKKIKFSQSQLFLI